MVRRGVGSAIWLPLDATPMYRSVDFARKILLYCLIQDPDAKNAHPKLEQVRFFQSVIGRKYPHVASVWAAVDGLKLDFQRTIQNMFFNGWTHGHYINSVFVFTPDGKIRICIISRTYEIPYSDTEYGISFWKNRKSKIPKKNCVYTQIWQSSLDDNQIFMYSVYSMFFLIFFYVFCVMYSVYYCFREWPRYYINWTQHHYRSKNNLSVLLSYVATL